MVRYISRFGNRREHLRIYHALKRRRTDLVRSHGIERVRLDNIREAFVQKLRERIDVWRNPLHCCIL